MDERRVMKEKLQINILQDLESEIIGQKLCRMDFRKDKSVSLGLGNRIQPRRKNTCVSFYGEWEVGSYNASWRILYNGEIAIASQSELLEYKAQEIQIDSDFILLKIQEITQYDIRFVFSNNLMVDFFNCYTEEDELFHVLKTDGTWWEKNCRGEWKKGKDELPPPPTNTK